MTHCPVCKSFFASALIACACLGLPSRFEPLNLVAAEEVAAPLELQGGDSRTNELQKILESQETLLTTVNRLCEEAEAATRRNEETIQKLREEATAATQRTRDELNKNSGALEQLIARQFESQVDVLQKMNHSTVLTFSALVGLGLLAFLGVAFVLWRAMRQMAQPVWAQTQVRVGHGEPVSALGGDNAKALPGASGAPAERTVLASVQKLDRLEKRLLQLESDTGSARAGGKGRKPASGARAAKNQPAEVRESLDRGQTLMKSGCPQEALECFVRALQTGAAGAEAHLWKGNALEQLGRLEEALRAYDDAIAADPTLNTAHLRKGGLCNRLGRLEEAFHSFEQVLESLGKP